MASKLLFILEWINTKEQKKKWQRQYIWYNNKTYTNVSIVTLESW